MRNADAARTGERAKPLKNNNNGCGTRFADLPPRRPPDVPGAVRLRVVVGGKT
jgi:hypothetical protein